TRAARSAGTSAGSLPSARVRRAGRRRSSTVSSGVACAAGAREQAHAAEVVVAALPDANLEAPGAERVERFVGETGLDVRQPADRMEARPRDGLLGVQALGEHACQHG